MPSPCLRTRQRQRPRARSIRRISQNTCSTRAAGRAVARRFLKSARPCYCSGSGKCPEPHLVPRAIRGAGWWRQLVAEWKGLMDITELLAQVKEVQNSPGGANALLERLAQEDPRAQAVLELLRKQQSDTSGTRDS